MLVTKMLCLAFDFIVLKKYIKLYIVLYNTKIVLLSVVIEWPEHLDGHNSDRCITVNLGIQ